MGNDYFIGEGNKIGYLPTEFGANGQIIEKTIKAGSNVVKGKLVAITGDLTVAHATSASTSVIGVAMFDTGAGQPMAFECEGLLKLTAGAAISAGAKVQSDDNADVITASTGQVVGFALNNANTGEAVYVKFTL
jgi:predicted RecA/RadA family phage recombinase